MSENKGHSGIALISTSALIASAFALIKARQASAQPLPLAGELGLDEATMNLLLAIAQASISIEESTALILKGLKNIPGDGIIAKENPENFAAFVVLPTIVNRAIGLPQRHIPWDHALVIKAYHTNAGTMFIAQNAADAQNVNSSYPLIANEAVELKIRNADKVWVTANTLGDSVVCIVEQERF